LPFVMHGSSLVNRGSCKSDEVIKQRNGHRGGGELDERW
jgi:hypothetical protein